MTSRSASARAGDLDVAAGDRRDDAPAAGLDVVAIQTVLERRRNRAGASTRIVDVPSPSIADAHRSKEPAELDDVRLHRRMANLAYARAPRRPRGAPFLSR